AGKHYELNFDDFFGPLSGRFLLDSSFDFDGTEITLATGPVVGSGSGVTVSAGDSSIDVTVNGGTQIVDAGDTADGTIVRAGGTQQVAGGGTASGTFVQRGGTQNVAGTDLDGTVNDGGVQNVLSCGFAIDTILNDPGVQSVGSGASASGVHISSGEQDVLSG